MLRANKLNLVKYNVSLIVALVVFIGAALLITGPAAFTAPVSGPIWSTPVNLGPVINSAFNDQQPAISPDGLSLYFTSNRPGIGGFDMYVAQRSSVNDPWGVPINLGPALNTTLDEGNAAFSRDGRLLFFQSKRLPSVGGIDIFVAQRDNPHDDFGWQPAVNLGPPINSAFDDQGPYYFEDDVRGTRQLYFASGRPGLAGNDIYVSEQMADDSFGPAMLVTELSSLLNESDPSIRHDGLETFFHSNRAGSIGSALDLWVATRGSTLDAWSTPVNLGSTINTASAEQNAYLSSDGMTLFFASDRPGGSGLLDLYMSTRTLPTVRTKNISVGANDSCAASINPSDVDDGSFDPVNGGPLTLSLDPSGPFDLGPHTVRLIATDNRGLTNSALAIVTVVDDTPPLITDASVDRPTLGPPNHRMVDVIVSYTATDNCGAVDTALTISSNEPVNGMGDGDTAPDWEVVNVHQVRLRAERSGQGNGRIYTIAINATDSNGNASSRLVTVSVPHN